MAEAFVSELHGRQETIHVVEILAKTIFLASFNRTRLPLHWITRNSSLLPPSTPAEFWESQLTLSPQKLRGLEWRLMTDEIVASFTSCKFTRWVLDL